MPENSYADRSPSTPIEMPERMSAHLGGEVERSNAEERNAITRATETEGTETWALNSGPMRRIRQTRRRWRPSGPRFRRVVRRTGGCFRPKADSNSVGPAPLSQNESGAGQFYEITARRERCICR